MANKRFSAILAAEYILIDITLMSWKEIEQKKPLFCILHQLL